ncbi:MAG TPA: response regulator [Kofleriaceae bacterium]|nr:response regulator [Kofleriaceae bacterium]
MTRDVLVIDDSATVRKLVEISLRGRPLQPHFADSGADGLRRAAALTPAAILLDYVLPDTTGVEVCRALASDPRTQAIPVLVVTAKPERMRAEFQAFPSVVDWITKPFAGPDLIARIERALAAAAGGGATRRSERRDPAERAAKLLFARLRDGLALLPSQLRSLEPGPIAPQLARRLLTPQVVEGILADLRPLCAELAASAAEREPADTTTRARPVVICEPDVETFQHPLRALLARRATSRELVVVDRVEQVLGVTRQRQPCLVVVNATARVAEVCAVAHAVRTDLALSDVAMIALIEARVGRPPDLLAAGFDAVLAKPVMVTELERFLIPTDLR